MENNEMQDIVLGSIGTGQGTSEMQEQTLQQVRSTTISLPRAGGEAGPKIHIKSTTSGGGFTPGDSHTELYIEGYVQESEIPEIMSLIGTLFRN